jgi:hypothetical protein
MQHYANDRRQVHVTFASLAFAAVIASALGIFVITRDSACTVQKTSSHHELLK